jgi:hypothetical protein
VVCWRVAVTTMGCSVSGSVVGAVDVAVAADASLARAAFPADTSTRQPVAAANPRHAMRTASLMAAF